MGGRTPIILQGFFRNKRNTFENRTLPTTDAPYVPLRRYGPAALAAATAAWRAGTDVQTALQQAGYAYEVVVGLSQYFQSASVPELELLSQSEPEMSSAKRARSSSSASATTTSAYARRRSAPVAPSVKRYVKGCVDRMLEVKVSTQAVVDVTPGTAGAVVSLPIFSIQQGDTDSTREGNMIHIRKLISLFWFFDTAATSTARVICFIDRQANGTTPSVTSVLQSASFAALYDPNTVIGSGGSRYKILYDVSRTQNLQIAATTCSAGPVVKQVSEKIPVQYQANTGAAADVLSNNVWFIMIGSSATATIRSSTQVHYIDN